MRMSVRRLVLVPFALLTLSSLALFSDRMPRALRAGEALAAVDSSRDKNANYDLASLDIFRKAIVQIKDNYVEPQRINPKEMFVSALNAVEKQVAEVMVEGATCESEQAKAHELAARGPAGETESKSSINVQAIAACGKIKVTAGSASREFDFRDIDTIWQIPLKMREVFSFLRENLVSQQDQREIEYAAVNGMLTTLDPHSWLLKPDVYKEMKVQTRGEFGGLGFVISMRDDKLTVVKVLKGTPANRAGIKPHDVITQIDNDRTDNMELQEAVDRMRGRPGTKVNIFLQHGKGTEPKKLELTRAVVTYETVTSKLLDQGVGYVRLSSFSGTTTRDMQAAIRQMKTQNGGTLKGLVLDMRSNPGGLLEQAIQVADTFIEEGTIVTTVGINGTLREPKLARNDGNEREFPMAVLINSESASASEIVAGAMKNLNRAVIVGRQSFGKGSVQVLYDFKDKDTGDESALKLTIAQYLTPGDISIQEVGIVPDIELVPSRVIKDHLDLFAPPKTTREADLDKHFSTSFARDEEGAKAARDRASGKPLETLRYVRDETARERKAREQAEAGGTALPEDDEEEQLDDDGVTVDYQMEFCRDLLLAIPSVDRREQLAKMPQFVEQRRLQEKDKVKKKLEELGLDWSPAVAAAQGEPKIVAEMTSNTVKAGESMELKLTAQNVGAAPAYRLRAFTKSENGILDRREFVFGLLKPGEKRTWTVPVKIPRYLPSRRDDVTVKWGEDGNHIPEELTVSTNIIELQRPAFASTYQVVPSGQHAHGDGLLHPGETFEVVLDVKNIGTGQAYDAYAIMRNGGDDKFTVKRGRGKLGVMKPGETRTASFLLTVNAAAEAGKIVAKLELGDRELYEIQKQKISMLVTSPVPSEPSASAVRVTSETALVLNAALPQADRLAQPKKGQILAAKGKVSGFYRVEWQKGRYGFIAADDVKEAPGAKAQLKTTELFQREPPRIQVSNVNTSHGGVTIDSDHLTLTGLAVDPTGLRDLQIFVQHENDYRKVFFRTARKAGDPASQLATQLDFTTELTLKPGNSTVYMIAREDDDLQTQKTLVIHRRGSALAKRAEAAPAQEH